ncbi:MAG: exopolysaccharide biosynthesis polyprenyl glycosylphosphotransferase, partial [Oscillospiraceae bacterium]|nr:exopolysaccharide biosynthesis polyprenyl glycosylphosphotransferase [Oscillospiraceae bacterium]
INMPKKAMIIYNYIEDLPILVSKIKKNPHRWKLTQLVRYDDQKILRKIRGNGAVFFFDVPREKRAPLLEFCYKHNKDIYISPDVSDIIVYSSSRLIVDDTTVLSATNYGMSFEQLLLKRLGDIIFSSIFIILTSPVMLFFAIAIMLYDRGPIIYKQKRLTKGGKEFNVLKFRSMIVNAEKNTGAMIAKEDDERITPIGKILRRFRIDELPQLFNIFKGDMSVVGPRPERMEIAEEYKKQLPEFQYRLKVKAGLTGLAQIMSKYNTTPKDKLTLDLAYIQQYSLWLDIKLMFQTLIVFLKSDSTEGSKDIDKDTVEFVKNQLKKQTKKQNDN